MSQSKIKNQQSRTSAALSLAAVIAFGGSVVLAGEGFPASKPRAAVARAAIEDTPSPQPPPASSLANQVRTGRVQIVRFEEPAGADVEIASAAGVVRLTVPGQVALQVGPVYRLQVTNITEKSRVTIYPTLRLIGSVSPPAQVDPLDFPVPVHFVPRDFEEASQGRLVRNIVYLEDPASAFAMAFPKGEIPVIDIGPNDDLMQRTIRVGRPVALLQFGDRVPLDGQFEDAQGAGPVLLLPENRAASDAETGFEIRPTSWQNVVGAASRAAAGLPGRPSAPACDVCPPVIRLPEQARPQRPRDEYLCDGGDRVPYAHFSGHESVVGLGASETVGQFSRPGEKPRIVTSNQVCVYAPRFGLVRSSSASAGSLQIEGPRGLENRLRRDAIDSRVGPQKRSQRTPALAVRQRQRPSSVAMNDVLGGVDELRIIAGVQQRDWLEGFAGRIGPNTFGQGDEARIAMDIEAAAAWSRPDSPAYTARTEGGGQITGYARTGETQQIREPYRKPGDLILQKTASPAAAQQGDTIEFVIYYRNPGERPVESVSILDSLLPRLEYVPGSAQTDRRAVFSATPNDANSNELRWDIIEPLPGGQGGVVWFKAKVR